MPEGIALSGRDLSSLKAGLDIPVIFAFIVKSVLYGGKSVCDSELRIAPQIHLFSYAMAAKEDRRDAAAVDMQSCHVLDSCSH